MNLFACCLARGRPVFPSSSPPSLNPHPPPIRLHQPSIVSINGLTHRSSTPSIGVLIHPALVLTTHSTLPSPDCAMDAEITLRYDAASLTLLKRKLRPDTFFITNAEIDSTIVACDVATSEMRALRLETSKIKADALDVGHTIYVMGYPEGRDLKEVAIADGFVTSDTEPVMRFQTSGRVWMRGSVGFDALGNFAFIVTDPKKQIADVVQRKSSKFDGSQKQCGTTIHAIRDWLEPQWRGNKDELFTAPPQAGSRRPTAVATAGAPAAESTNRKKSSLQVPNANDRRGLAEQNFPPREKNPGKQDDKVESNNKEGGVREKDAGQGEISTEGGGPLELSLREWLPKVRLGELGVGGVEGVAMAEGKGKGSSSGVVKVGKTLKLMKEDNEEKEEGEGDGNEEEKDEEEEEEEEELESRLGVPELDYVKPTVSSLQKKQPKKHPPHPHSHKPPSLPKPRRITSSSSSASASSRRLPPP